MDDVARALVRSDLDPTARSVVLTVAVRSLEAERTPVRMTSGELFAASGAGATSKVARRAVVELTQAGADDDDRRPLRRVPPTGRISDWSLDLDALERLAGVEPRPNGRSSRGQTAGAAAAERPELDEPRPIGRSSRGRSAGAAAADRPELDEPRPNGRSSRGQTAGAAAAERPELAPPSPPSPPAPPITPPYPPEQQQQQQLQRRLAAAGHAELADWWVDCGQLVEGEELDALVALADEVGEDLVVDVGNNIAEGLHRADARVFLSRVVAGVRRRRRLGRSSTSRPFAARPTSPDPPPTPGPDIGAALAQLGPTLPGGRIPMAAGLLASNPSGALSMAVRAVVDARGPEVDQLVAEVERDRRLVVDAIAALGVTAESREQFLDALHLGLALRSPIQLLHPDAFVVGWVREHYLEALQAAVAQVEPNALLDVGVGVGVPLAADEADVRRRAALSLVELPMPEDWPGGGDA